MNSNINIDHLFVEEKPFLEPSNALKKAALLFDFSIEQDFQSFNKEELMSLHEKSEFNAKGRMFLTNSARKEVLESLLEQNQFEKLVQELNLEENGYTKILVDVLNNKAFDLEKLNVQELFYLHKLSVIYPKRISSTQVGNIKFELEKRQLLNHFSILTKDFAGREKEYNDLKAYVDWLPDRKLKSALESRFRNLINWHDKNPMLITGIGGIGK